VTTLFIEPGSPWENGYIESFNGKLRDELLDREVFETLLEAKVLIEGWRVEYNTIRPHSSLGLPSSSPGRAPAREACFRCAPAAWCRLKIIRAVLPAPPQRTEVLQFAWTVQCLNSGRSFASRTRPGTRTPALNDAAPRCSTARNSTAPAMPRNRSYSAPAPVLSSTSRGTTP
jgi:hypothetical protein